MSALFKFLRKTALSLSGLFLIGLVPLSVQAEDFQNGAASVPAAKSFLEGRASTLAGVSQGQSLAAGSGIRAARDAGPGLAPFAAAEIGHNRYSTGSHIHVNGLSALTGLAYNSQLEPGDLTLGAFLEAGRNKHTASSSAGFRDVGAHGHTNYIGFGLLGRFDFEPDESGHLYTEASASIGTSHMNYASNDVHGVFGGASSYKSDARYFGIHAGAGYLWQIFNQTNLDLYAKGLWTHLNSDSVTVSGVPVYFDSADSRRLRAGARLAYTLSTESGLRLTPYAGAAWEHEFSGDISGTTYGYDINNPDLSGGTGIGEIGLSLVPSANSQFSFDVDLKSYTGVRHGVSGGAAVKWRF